MVMKGDQSTFGTGSPESRYMLSVPGRDVNGMASSKSLGEIDELGLHDTESEDGSMSEGTVVVKDDGFSESTSAEVEHLHEEVNEEEENSKKEDVKKKGVTVADESDPESSQGGADSGGDEQEGNATELDDEGTAVILGKDTGGPPNVKMICSVLLVMESKSKLDGVEEFRPYFLIYNSRRKGITLISSRRRTHMRQGKERKVYIQTGTVMRST